MNLLTSVFVLGERDLFELAAQHSSLRKPSINIMGKRNLLL